MGRLADQWEDGFSRLLRYVKDEGDARVPQSYKVDGYRLGTWVNSQRANFRKGILDSDRQRGSRNCPVGHGTLAPTGGGRVQPAHQIH